jgi:hypothetical protein
MILTILRCLAFLGGSLAYYIAFFMYEDGEGKLQNRMEQLWIAVNDKKKITGSMASALFNKVASVVARAFDRVFGSKLISLQLVGVSVCYALAGLFLFLPIFMWILIQLGGATMPAETQTRQTFIFVGKVLVTGGLILLTLGSLPALKKSSITVGLSLNSVDHRGRRNNQACAEA